MLSRHDWYSWSSVLLFVKTQFAHLCFFASPAGEASDWGFWDFSRSQFELGPKHATNKLPTNDPTTTDNNNLQQQQQQPITDTPTKTTTTDNITDNNNNNWQQQLATTTAANNANQYH